MEGFELADLCSVEQTCFMRPSRIIVFHCNRVEHLYYSPILGYLKSLFIYTRFENPNFRNNDAKSSS